MLVGVGTCLDAGEEPVELMARAALAAGDDAGVPALLQRVQRIAVAKGTWSYRDPGRVIADCIGAPAATTVLVELGIPQQTLVSDTLRRIADGEIDVALVVGGEAKRSAVPETAQPEDVTPDEHVRGPGADLLAPAERKARLWNAVEQYALIECALRRADAQGLEEHRDELAVRWAAWNEVAQGNPEAAFPEPKDPAFLRDPGPGNRPLAFPYNKWHSTQWTVDQAAALLLCSPDAARAAGVDPDRWVHPAVALESSHLLPLSRRAHMHEWAALRTLAFAATTHLGRPLDSIEHVEVYSCFPAATRVQQRELGLSDLPPPTVTGGMAFAGGPFNSFTYQATAAIARRLRHDRGSLGMVTTVSGFLTKPGLMIWSSEPLAHRPLIADLADLAAAATKEREAADDHEGPVTVAAYTVTYDGDAPCCVKLVGHTQDLRTVVRTIDDARLARDATTSDLVGTVL